MSGNLATSVLPVTHYYWCVTGKVSMVARVQADRDCPLVSRPEGPAMPYPCRVVLTDTDRAKFSRLLLAGVAPVRKITGPVSCQRPITAILVPAGRTPRSLGRSTSRPAPYREFVASL